MGTSKLPTDKLKAKLTAAMVLAHHRMDISNATHRYGISNANHRYGISNAHHRWVNAKMFLSSPDAIPSWL